MDLFVMIQRGLRPVQYRTGADSDSEAESAARQRSTSTPRNVKSFPIEPLPLPNQQKLTSSSAHPPAPLSPDRPFVPTMRAFKPIAVTVSILIVVLLTLSLASLTRSQPQTQSDDSVAVNETVAAVVAEFFPTHEWQEIPAGASIPPGLWVRLDMTTGKKTARLIPEEDSSEAHISRIVVADEGSPAIVELDVVSDTDKLLAVNIIEEGNDTVAPIIEIGAVESDGESDEISLVSDYVESVGSLGSSLLRELEAPDSNGNGTARTYSEADLALLKALRAQRLRELASHFAPTEDLAVIKAMLSLVSDPLASFEHVLQALETMELLLHQVDNAVDAVHLGLLDVVLNIFDAPLVNETIHNHTVAVENLRLMQLQEQALWLLGTAAQNNPHVGEESRKDGAIPIIIQLILRCLAETPRLWSDDPTISREKLVEHAYKVLAKSVYALSSLLRSQPPSQHDFFVHGGPDALLQLVQQSLGVLTRTTGTPIIEQKWPLTVLDKSVSLVQSLVDDKFFNDKSDAHLFRTLTNLTFCQLYRALVTEHAPRLLNHSIVAASQPLLTLRLVDNLLHLVLDLTQHLACGTVFMTLPDSLADFNALLLSMMAREKENETHQYWFSMILDKMQRALSLFELVPAESINVYHTPLTQCSSLLQTGYRHDGFCHYELADTGLHTVCAFMNDQFLEWIGHHDPTFPALKPHDTWCLNLSQWNASVHANHGAGVVLSATHNKTTEFVSLDALLRYEHHEQPSHVHRVHKPHRAEEL